MSEHESTKPPEQIPPTISQDSLVALDKAIIDGLFSQDGPDTSALWHDLHTTDGVTYARLSVIFAERYTAKAAASPHGVSIREAIIGAFGLAFAYQKRKEEGMAFLRQLVILEDPDVPNN